MSTFRSLKIIHALLLKIACFRTSETKEILVESNDKESLNSSNLGTRLTNREHLAQATISPKVIKETQMGAVIKHDRGNKFLALRQSLFVLVFFVLLAPIMIFFSVFEIPNSKIAWNFLGIRRSLPLCRNWSKGPMVQLIGDQKIMVMWESCDAEVETRYFLKTNASTKETEIEGSLVWWDDGMEPKTVYRAFLDNVSTDPLNISIRSVTNSKSKESFTISLPQLESKRRLRIAVVGDNQNGTRVFRKALAVMTRTNPDIILHVGDMVQDPYNDLDWQKQFFDPLKLSGLMQDKRFIITQGNHDVHGKSRAAYFAPLNELKGQPAGYYYAQTIGTTRFIVCDSNTEDPRQLEWLRNELLGEESQKAAFRIVSVHVSPFIEYWDPMAWIQGEKRWPCYVRNNMVRIFEQGRVDLVISGHQHNYQRGRLNGVTYIVTGGGGGKLDAQRVEEFDSIYQTTVISHHLVMLDITPRKIRVTMHQINGNIGDSFTINRRHN